MNLIVIVYVKIYLLNLICFFPDFFLNNDFIDILTKNYNYCHNKGIFVKIYLNKYNLKYNYTLKRFRNGIIIEWYVDEERPITGNYGDFKITFPNGTILVGPFIKYKIKGKCKLITKSGIKEGFIETDYFDTISYSKFTIENLNKFLGEIN